MLTKKCTKCKNFLPIEHFGKLSSASDGLKYRCKACIKVDKAEFAKAHPDKIKEWQLNWAKNNPEMVRNGNLKRTRRWNSKNRPKRREMTKRWFDNNPGMRAIYGTARRESCRIQAISLSKSETSQFLEIYRDAKILSDTTGIPHHVDHIIPLRAGTVMGLHVPWNLQIITAEQNLKKNNKVPDGATGLAFLRIAAS